MVGRQNRPNQTKIANHRPESQAYEVKRRETMERLIEEMLAVGEKYAVLSI